jgi:DNA-binding transcriptional MerR regulator
MQTALPEIPGKRYFTIGEVSELCGVKPYVLRYWEQEFTQLRPMKRRGNRRYYQHHEVLLISRIRDLLYEQGFTISGARNRLAEGDAGPDALPVPEVTEVSSFDAMELESQPSVPGMSVREEAEPPAVAEVAAPNCIEPPHGLTLRDELMAIRTLLELDF